MSRLNARQTAVFAAIVVFAVTGAILATRAESKPADRSAVIAGTDTTEAKSHGPCRPGHRRSHGPRRLSTRMRKCTQSSYGKDPTALLVCRGIRT